MHRPPLKSVALMVLLLAGCRGHAPAEPPTGGSEEAIEFRPTGEPNGTFVSLEISGTCVASIRYIHRIESHPPHPWYILPVTVRHALRSSPRRTPDNDLEVVLAGSVPLSAPSDADLSSAKRFLVVAEAAPSPSSPPTSIAHLFPDPRVKHLHGFHGANEDTHTWEGHERLHHPAPPTHHISHTYPTAVEHLWFPGGVEHFTLFCHNASARMEFSLSASTHPHHRPYHEMSTTDPEIEVINQFVAGPPATQLNIIFLAGGFTREQKEGFLANVSALTDMMMDPSLNPRNLPPDVSANIANMHRSVPLNRYWPFFNVYAVWQPSNEAGASRPLLGQMVDNNLKCQHPAFLERAVNCDRDLALALADTTPARPMLYPDRCLIIALVNTPIYGGSGVFIRGKLHMGNFFNQYNLNEVSQREKMLSLMDHECGHALGNLMDEYDVGATDETGRVLLNCQAGAGGAPPSSVQWQHWIDVARADPAGWVSRWGNGLVNVGSDSPQEWGILSIPQSVCGYRNYFKPSENCMMNRLNNFFMCPVCREAESLTIMSTPFSLAWPRRPLLDVVVLVPKSDNSSNTVNYNSAIILHLPVYLVPANGFFVKAYDVDGTPLPFDPKPECPVCFKLNQTNFAKYPVNQVVFINVTIEDRTVFISDVKKPLAAAQLNQTTFFRVMVVDSVDPAMANVTLQPGSLSNVVGVHEVDQLSTYILCRPLQANATAVCSLNFTSKQYQAPLDVEGELSKIEVWVYGVVGGVAALFLILWLYAANRYKRSSDGRPRPILKTEFNCFVTAVRMIMMGAAILFMLASLGTMGLACYYYTKTSALGKIIIFAGLGLAFGLYIMAFIGYWAVSSRSKRMLLVNGAVLFIGLSILAAAIILVTFIGQDMKHDDGFWTGQLQTLWRSTVEEFPDRACAIQDMLVCSGFNHSCSDVVGSSLDCPINCEATNEANYVPCRSMLRDYINDNYFTIVQILGSAGGLQLIGLLFNFIFFCALVKAKREIRAQHKKLLQQRQGKGKVQDRHKALYILKSLGSNNTPALIREFKRVDADGNGSLSKSELYAFLKATMYYRASKDEIDCIFELADVDNSGTISLPEFLAIFGRRLPESSSTQKAKAARVRRQMREKLSATDLYDQNEDMEFERECDTYKPPTLQQLRTPEGRSTKMARDLDELL